MVCFSPRVHGYGTEDFRPRSAWSSSCGAKAKTSDSSLPPSTGAPVRLSWNVAPQPRTRGHVPPPERDASHTATMKRLRSSPSRARLPSYARTEQRGTKPATSNHDLVDRHRDPNRTGHSFDAHLPPIMTTCNKKTGQQRPLLRRFPRRTRGVEGLFRRPPPTPTVRSRSCSPDISNAPFRGEPNCSRQTKTKASSRRVHPRQGRRITTSYPITLRVVLTTCRCRCTVPGSRQTSSNRFHEQARRSTQGRRARSHSPGPMPRQIDARSLRASPSRNSDRSGRRTPRRFVEGTQKLKPQPIRRDPATISSFRSTARHASAGMKDRQFR